MIQRILRRRLLILLVVAISLLVFLFSNRASSQAQWQMAKAISPPALLKKIAKENFLSGRSVDVGRMKVLRVKRAQSLYLVDTRVVNAAEQPHGNPLCGAQMCLFLGYTSTSENQYQRVLNLYLNPALPPKTALIQPTQETVEGLPCLLVHQLEQQQIRQTKLCIHQGSYEIAETQLLQGRYE